MRQAFGPFPSNRSRIVATIILLITVSGLFPVSLLIPDAVAAGKKQRVLILHSFHKGQKWNDDLSRGIFDVLDNDLVELHFEYMDAKRYADARHFENLYQLYRHKYRTRPVDVIISTDESALDFLLAHRDDLFPGTVVVFCGVKFLEENKLYGERNITGVIEQVDIEKNIRLILQLTPAVKHILVITDNSPTSISTIKSFIPVLKTFGDRINFHFTEQMAVADLQQSLQGLSPEHAVLLVNYTRDIDGNLFSMEESARIISLSSPVPVYALWDSYLGSGILGGLLVSGYTQGKIAAHMAQALLAGGTSEQTPIRKSTAGHTMFDYRQLKKFGIPERKLPVDAVVINRPISFYYQYKLLILAVLLGILGLTAIIVVLSINIVRRRRVEKSLQKTSQRLTLMHEIDRAILNAFSIEFVAEKLMAPMRHIFGCEFIGILLIQKGDPQATVLAHYPLENQVTSREFSIPGDTLPLESLTRGVIFRSDGVYPEAPAFAGQWSDHFPGTRYLLTPIIYQEDLLGALILGSPASDLKNETLVSNSWEVADSLAVAIQNNRLLRELRNHEEELRSMSAHIIEAQEMERKRLSVELHDEFGQMLTAVSLNLSLIRNKLGADCSRSVAERLDQTESAIENLYDQIHDLSLDLRPTILDDLGLTPTLRWYLNQYQERSGRQVHFSAGEEPGIAIPGAVAVALYRILQEALTNITKYAGASTITVRLITEPDTIQLIIADDGIGFDLEAIQSRNIKERGLGLVGMRERLDLLNGSLQIQTEPGRGTTLHAVVPIYHGENDD
ncbi:MAG: ABC transporter substrate binding protein [bacterium]